jgi:hypothetical protein
MFGMSWLTAYIKRSKADKADFEKLQKFLDDMPEVVSAVFEADIVEAFARLNTVYCTVKSKQKLHKVFETVSNNLNVFIVLDHQERIDFPALEKQTVAINPAIINEKNIAALQGAFDALHDVALAYGCAFSPSTPQELLEQASDVKTGEEGLSITFNRYAPYRIFNHPSYDRFDNDVQFDLRLATHSRFKKEVSSTPRW